MDIHHTKSKPKDACTIIQLVSCYTDYTFAQFAHPIIYIVPFPNPGQGNHSKAYKNNAEH
jgi:hypothetical protein